MDTSVIIVNYNTKELVLSCIQSVLDKTIGLTFEIIVVDNASTDGSAKMIKKRFPNVKLIENPLNVGYGSANNIGMRFASGNYYLFLNPDTVFINNAAKIIYDYMELAGNRDVGICGGCLFDEQNRPGRSFGKFPRIASMILWSLPSSSWVRKGTGIISDCVQEPFYVDFVVGADMLVRKQVMERTGDFDEKYFAYYEETDLAQRALRLGFRSAIVPAAKLFHYEGKSFKGTFLRRKMMFESSLHYLNKYERNKLLFNAYCRLNECKYALYKVVASGEEVDLLREMISRSKSYRRPEAPKR